MVNIQIGMSHDREFGWCILNLKTFFVNLNFMNFHIIELSDFLFELNYVSFLSS